MRTDESESTIRTLLEILGRTFNLDRSFCDRPLGAHLEEIIREAAATEMVEFGVPGDAAELRRSSEGAMNFFYRPHLFPGMVRRSSGAVDSFPATAVPIALLPEMETASSSFQLDPGDAVVICTDGLLELQNDEGEVFGLDHTIESIAASDGSPCGIYSNLTRTIAEFHDLDRLDDDLSFVAMRL